MLCSVLCVNIRWIWVLYAKKSVCTLKENMVDAYTLHIPAYYTVSKELVNFSILWQSNGKLSSVLISGHTQHVLDIRARFRRLHTHVLEHIFYSWNALRTAHLVRDCTRFGKRDAIPNEVMCMRAKALKAQTTSASRTSVSPKYTVRSGWMINSDICMYNTRKHTLTHTHTPVSERL